MFRRILFLGSVAAAVAFVPLYLLLWIQYPRWYFSQYILTPHGYLGYALYFLVMAQVALYGLNQILRKRWFLSAASFLTGLFIFWIMVYPPTSYDHFAYFMYAMAFAIGILACDFFGSHLVSFVDSKETAMIVLLAAPMVVLFVIIISACSPTIEKAVIVTFVLGMFASMTWVHRG